MDAVGFSESTPPLYYALAWVWTQLTGTGEFGLRSLSAAGRGGDGPGRLPDRARAARPPRRPDGGGAGRGQPDAALVLAGGARLRAAGPALRALAALLRARRCAAAAAATSSSGGSPPASPSPPTTSPSSRSSPRRSGCCAAAVGRAPAGHRRSSPSPAWRWRRWRSTRCPSATPNGSALLARPPALGNRGDLRQRRDRRHHRPPGAARCWPSCRWRSASAPLALLALRGAARGAPRRGAAAEPRRWSAIGIPVALALLSPEQGLRPRPQPDAGAGAAAGRGRDRGDAARRPPPRRRARRRPGRLLARLLRLGQRLAGPAAAQLGRGRRRLGEPAAPRATVTWTLGEAPLRYYLSTGAIQVRAPKATTGWCTKSTSSPRARRRRRRRACSGPGFRETARAGRRPPLHPPLPAAGPGPGAAAPARSCASADSTSAPPASSSTASARSVTEHLASLVGHAHCV